MKKRATRLFTDLFRAPGLRLPASGANADTVMAALRKQYGKAPGVVRQFETQALPELQALQRQGLVHRFAGAPAGAPSASSMDMTSRTMTLDTPYPTVAVHEGEHARSFGAESPSSRWYAHPPGAQERLWYQEEARANRAGMRGSAPSTEGFAHPATGQAAYAEALTPAGQASYQQFLAVAGPKVPAAVPLAQKVQGRLTQSTQTLASSEEALQRLRNWSGTLSSTQAPLTPEQASRHVERLKKLVRANRAAGNQSPRAAAAFHRLRNINEALATGATGVPITAAGQERLRQAVQADTAKLQRLGPLTEARNPFEAPGYQTPEVLQALQTHLGTLAPEVDRVLGPGQGARYQRDMLSRLPKIPG